MNRITRQALAMACATICLPGLAIAEDQSQAPEMIVSATRFPMPTKEVASSYTIITAKDIETHQYQTIIDALKSVPGLSVAQSGSTGTLTSIFSRGASSNQTLVQINGIAINDPSSPGGAANIASIPLDNVERIEIIRGPQSALYGSQAMGGVVNIITKSGTREPVTSLRIEGGTLGTLNTSASTGGHAASTDYFFSMTREATKGSDATPSRLHGAQGSERDGNEVHSGSAALKTRLNDTLSASTFLQYSDADTDFDSDGMDAFFANTYQNPDSKLRSKKLLTNASLDGSFHDGQWAPTLRIGYTRQTARTTDQPDVGGSIYAEDDVYTGKKLEAAFDNTFRITDGNRLSLGTSFTRDAYQSSGIRDFGGGYFILPQSNVHTTALAAYGSHHMTFGDGFFLTLSGRYDKPKGIDGRFSYTIAPGTYLKQTDTKLVASFGTGFKAPSLQQRYGYDPDSFGGYYIGNPNLKPETSQSWDAGFEQGLPFSDALIGVSWYQSRVRNAIAVVYDIFFNSTAVNVNEFRTRGLEAFFEIRPFDTVTTRVDYTFTILEADVFASTLARRPRHQIGVTTQWAPWDGTQFSADYQWTDPYRDIPRDGFGYYLNPAPYSVVNVAASQTLTKSVTLTGRVNNLFDQTYEPVNGFQAPGVEALAGISVSF